MTKSTEFLQKLNRLDFAFQPIVDITTREIYAVEALLRNVEEIGFNSIHHFFDAMYQHHLLYAVDLLLRRRAIEKFSKIHCAASLKLFYNLDNRLLEMKDYTSGNTEIILQQYGLEKSALCFEISERHEVTRECEQIRPLLEHYQAEDFTLAIDDFGVGFSGFKLLYEFTPDIIKIDRFFINGICKDPKKRIIVEHIIPLAKQLGVKIIAEGVELESELAVCREIGCEYVQGYLIQKPTCLIDEIKKESSIFTQVA